MDNKSGVLLDRAALLAVDFAGQEDRYNMTSVHVKADGTTEATNDHYAIRVPPCPLPVDDYPAVAGMGTGFNGAGIMVPAEACKAALKALPKRSTIPILTAAHLGANGTPGMAVLTTTDLETAAPRTFKMPDGQFPNLDKVIPTDDTERIVIGINAAYLKQIADYAIKVAGNRKQVIVALSIPKTDAPDNVMRWDITIRDTQTARIALMPCEV